ncbi:MAG: ABC transporter substrate binding protein [Betaproteobacteria bacterium]
MNPASSHATRQWKLVDSAGARAGVSVTPAHISGPQDIDAVFELLRVQRVDGVIFAPDPSWWVGNERRIAEQLIRQRLPAVASVREFADHGVMVAYGTNFVELWRKAAVYVDQILKGAKPAELAIEHPTKFDLVINQRTARAIGLSVPRVLLLRADHVID